MTARAGERALETGTFHCDRCNHTVRVQKGERLPPCPCGGGYGRRTAEPKQGEPEFKAAMPEGGLDESSQQRRNLRELKRQSDSL